MGDLFVRCRNKLNRIADYISNQRKYFLLNLGLAGLVKHRKKLIGFYGECHIYVYGSALSKCAGLKKKYVIIGAKEIEYLARWHHKQINKESAWKYLDVLIYNPGVPERTGAPTLQKVLEWIPENCQKIEVTNAAFKGYMPQHTERVFKNNGYFIWGDKNLNKLISDEKSIEETNLRNIYTEQYVNDYFDKSIRHMKMYEKDCTVKIADYIEKHGKNRVLYYSVTHPETEIMAELTHRILEVVGISAKISDAAASDPQFNLHSHGEVIYPCVFTGLGIAGDPDKRLIQPGNYKELQYSFDEYAKEYLRMAKEAAAAERQ